MDTPEDVLEVEEMPEEEPKVVGFSMLVGDHPELMEVAQVEMEVHTEAATTRAETLRVWAQGLLDAQLERGVPHAPKVQTWKGATVQGAHCGVMETIMLKY